MEMKKNLICEDGALCILTRSVVKVGLDFRYCIPVGPESDVDPLWKPVGLILNVPGEKVRIQFWINIQPKSEFFKTL